MDQFIYFINHLAAQNVSPHQRGINAIIFIGIPGLLALIILFGLMRLIRGNKIFLMIANIFLFLFCIIIPFVAVLHSLIYLNINDQILPAFLLYLMFGYALLICTEECYMHYRYKTEEEYKRHTFSNGYHVEEIIENGTKFIRSNFLFFIAHLLMLASAIVYFIERVGHINLGIFSTVLIACSFFLITSYFAIFRYFLRCPHCHQTIYGLESKPVIKNNRRVYNKSYYFCTMIRILKYHRFTCMYCYGHFILGKRDIIKEHGWTIENKHEPDFMVKKQ